MTCGVAIFIGLWAAISIRVVVEANPEDGFCSNVQQMHQHCVREGGSVPIESRGKAGPRGEKGERGATGVVDYDLIDQKIGQKFDEVQESWNRKFDECKRNSRGNEAKIEQLEEKLKRLIVTDCTKVLQEDSKATRVGGGVFDIYLNGKKTEVFCDMDTDGGGWIVFQRREDGSVDFFRPWNDYVSGFGTKTGEFWLGLDMLNRITSSGNFELQIDLEDWSGVKKFAKYSNFEVGDESSNYQLKIGGYSGNAGDALARHNGQRFTTKDRDQDIHGKNCAVLYKGGWWYDKCHESNLNGLYHKGGAHSSYADGINWRQWKGYHYSMKFVEMKLRPQ